MEELLLSAEERPTQKSGTKNSRRYRREGLIPGVVYGHGEEPISVLVNYVELRSVLTTDAGLNAIIALDIGGKRKLSIVKELQQHPIRQDVLHVDFLLINPDEEVQVEVPISLIGVAKKVEQEQGIVDQILFNLTVLAKADDIPNILELDITDWEVGTSITVADLKLPPGARTLMESDTPVASAELTRMAFAEEEAAEVEGEEGAEGEEDSDDEADSEDGEDSSDSEGDSS